MEELRPGVFLRVLGRVQAEGLVRAREALGRTARIIETDAKVSLARSTHRPRERTGAVPGGPPALVSGTLRRSVTHLPVTMRGGSWETRVGPAAGFYPNYGGRSRTSSSRYGLYLETGLRNGARYPWLEPAWRAGLAATEAMWRSAFTGGW